MMRDGTPIITDFGLVKFANPVRDVSEMYCTLSVSLLDTELARFARELGAQYRSVADAPAASEDEITRSVWEQCAARTGILGDETRLQSVRTFLNQAQRQSRRDGPDLDGLTQADTVMGSPNYMAPEQAIGDLAQIGPRTDVYALGSILYELLTGRPPFRSKNLVDLLSQTCSAPPTPPRQLVPEVSRDIEAMCLKCLEKSPVRRYQNAADLAEDLSRFLGGYSPRAGTASTTGALPESAHVPDDVPSTLALDTRTLQAVPVETRSWWPFRRGRSKANK
jgi:serine/threonine protein kinase